MLHDSTRVATYSREARPTGSQLLSRQISPAEISDGREIGSAGVFEFALQFFDFVTEAGGVFEP
jgi:hypothetical protein